jgi:hypothetical protein
MYLQICIKHVSKDRTFVIIVAFFLMVTIAGLFGTAIHNVFAAMPDLKNITSSNNTQKDITSYKKS